ncbi:hypothetical protein H9Q73_006950 [Fusarium xylarioides]|nr:hypothetical protein H9Q73_006950 [Fusarium xylarioides]
MDANDTKLRGLKACTTRIQVRFRRKPPIILINNHSALNNDSNSSSKGLLSYKFKFTNATGNPITHPRTLFISTII